MLPNGNVADWQCCRMVTLPIGSVADWQCCRMVTLPNGMLPNGIVAEVCCGMVARRINTEIFSTSEYQKTNMSIGFSIVDLVENQSLVGYGPHFH